jgi:hypothetical protein
METTAQIICSIVHTEEVMAGTVGEEAPVAKEAGVETEAMVVA